MPNLTADRVKETTTTTGTGTVTLAGAVAQFRSFASAFADGSVVQYAIVGQTGTEWEVGNGTFTASGTTLARTTVLASSNANAAVNFSAGTKDVFATVTAAHLLAAVLGPASATDNAVARFDSTTGKLVQNSGLVVNDSGSAEVAGGQGYYEAGRISGLKLVGDSVLVVHNTYPRQRLGNGPNIEFGDGGGGFDTLIERLAAGQLTFANETNGQANNLKTSATTKTLSGATTTATGLFPAKCIRLGVSYRVTTLVTSGDGGTSFNVGDGTDVDLYGATKAFAAGTTGNLTDATADPTVWNAAAGDVVFTCVGGTFSGGVVRVVAHYIDLTAPTS